MFGISIPQLLIILGIIVLLFGTKKLRNIGGDLGSAIKGFKKAMNDDDAADKDADFKEPNKVEDKSAQANKAETAQTSQTASKTEKES